MDKDIDFDQFIEKGKKKVENLVDENLNSSGVLEGLHKISSSGKKDF
jgi:hypothetical protein